MSMRLKESCFNGNNPIGLRYSGAQIHDLLRAAKNNPRFNATSTQKTRAHFTTIDLQFTPSTSQITAVGFTGVDRILHATDRFDTMSEPRIVIDVTREENLGWIGNALYKHENFPLRQKDSVKLVIEPDTHEADLPEVNAKSVLAHLTYESKRAQKVDTYPIVLHPELKLWNYENLVFRPGARTEGRQTDVALQVMRSIRESDIPQLYNMAISTLEQFLDSIRT